MKYAGHRVFYGGHPNGKSMVVVYAKPYPDRGWELKDPAQLKGCPDYFNAAMKGHAPTFRRDHWCMNPEQMRFEVVDIGVPHLLLQAILRAPTPESEIINMRQLQNAALAFAQKAGFISWGVMLVDPKSNPFTFALTDDKPLPEPQDPKLVQLATEQDLRNIEHKQG